MFLCLFRQLPPNVSRSLFPSFPLSTGFILLTQKDNYGLQPSH